MISAAIIFALSFCLSWLRASWQGDCTAATGRILGACLFLALLFGGIIAFLQTSLLGISHNVIMGSTGGPPPPVLTFSKVRALTKQERWDEARAELEGLWIAYPGNGEILREYDRFYSELHAPAGMADFIRRAVPHLKGEDRTYAYLRMAELLSEHADRKPEARIWCRRILAEYPGSPHAASARTILENLPTTRQAGSQA